MTRFPDRFSSAAGADALWFSPRGLHIGYVRINPGALSDVIKSSGGPHDRFEALLAIAFGRQLQPTQYEAIAAAAESACRGDQALANIRLIMSRLGPIPDSDTIAQRLMQADQRIIGEWDRSDQPHEPSCKARTHDMEKYNRNQPRVPAGNGEESGRFGDGDGSNVAKPIISSGQVRIASAAVAIRVVTGPSFLAPGVAAEAITALGTFAVAIGGAAAVFGLVFVPSPNKTSTDGKLPGNDGLTYHYDHDEGTLQLRDASGAIVAAGPRDRSGLFHDADTGIPFGRDIGGTLVFEQASMVAAGDSAESVPRTATDAAEETDKEPRLCPDPVTEPDNGASKRAKAYQEQISASVNLHDRIPYGLAMAFFNPKTGRWVRADDCDQKDGALIEAKGPGFAKNLKYDFLLESYENGFVRQARAQVEAAGARDVRWYFAERATADVAAKAFAGDTNLAKIKIQVIEAIVK